MGRRVAAILIISMLLVLGTAASAFATAGDSTYTVNPAGQNPHGGYQVATRKCAVCHAVHHAGELGEGSGSELLLRSTVGEACTYCHVSPGVSTKIVYGGDPAKYSGSDLPNAHNNFGAQPASCTSCHQVHAAAAAMTANALLTDYILKRPADGVAYDPDAGPPLVTDNDKDLAVSKWCTSCHQYWPGDMVDSHVLASQDATHSFVSSTYCSSCHNSNTVGGVANASAFPHYTDGVRFLTQSTSDNGGGVGVPATSSTNDGVCLRCHRNGAGAGIGLTF